MEYWAAIKHINGLYVCFEISRNGEIEKEMFVGVEVKGAKTPEDHHLWLLCKVKERNSFYQLFIPTKKNIPTV